MRRITLAVLVVIAAASAPCARNASSDEGAAPAKRASSASTHRAVVEAFEEQEYARAASLIEAWLEAHPGDPTLLYNLACARSRLGETDQATRALYRAVEAGFRDFSLLASDPDLAAIRSTATYRAMIDAWERTSAEQAESALERWKRTWGGEAYRFEVDEERKLAFATALDEQSHAEMRRMLQEESDILVATLFGAPLGEYVLVVIPTPADADELLDDPEIGGRYEHGSRRLISRNIGGSLRHEFVHALHYGHMERLRLRTPHRLWVQEGLATLFEDYTIEDDGTVVFPPNDRANVDHRRARVGTLTPWKTLFAMEPDAFMKQARKLYPQVRSIFRFVAERNDLQAWYRAYVETFDEDPDGAAAFEAAFGKPVGEIEREWKMWARVQPTVDMRIDGDDAALGIVSGYNTSNDGVLIEDIVRGSGAHDAGLRAGDVITAIDERPVRAWNELRAIIGAKSTGERAAVRVRRRGEYFTVEVALRPVRQRIR